MKQESILSPISLTRNPSSTSFLWYSLLRCFHWLTDNGLRQLCRKQVIADCRVRVVVSVFRKSFTAMAMAITNYEHLPPNQLTEWSHSHKPSVTTMQTRGTAGVPSAAASSGCTAKLTSSRRARSNFSASVLTPSAPSRLGGFDTVSFRTLKAFFKATWVETVSFNRADDRGCGQGYRKLNIYNIIII